MYTISITKNINISLDMVKHTQMSVKITAKTKTHGQTKYITTHVFKYSNTYKDITILRMSSPGRQNLG